MKLKLKRSLIICLTAGLFDWWTDSHALSRIPVIHQGSSNLTLSKSDFTRIGVEGDRIAQVIGRMDFLILEQDETQGQIFLRPKEGAKVSSRLLSITTEQGLIQDLSLHFMNKPSEAILLVKTPEKAASSTPQLAVDSQEQQVREMLRDLVCVKLRSKIFNASYYPIKTEDQILKIPNASFEITLEKGWRKGSYEGFIGVVRNNSDVSLDVSPKDIMTSESQGCVIGTKYLRAGESGYVFLVQGIKEWIRHVP